MERDPAAVLQAAIRGVVEKLPDAIREDRDDQIPEFLAANFFTGQKPGYYFGNNQEGTGYYLDPLSTFNLAESKAAEKQNLTPTDLLKEAEEQAALDEVQLLDAKSLKRHVAVFERKYKENMEMRMKYAEQPEKFMESEVDLDEEVQRLLAVAGSPELYPEFVKLGAVENLMALLSHDNTDIAADVIDLFQQLTDADIVEDSEEEAAVLVDSMIEHNGIELLVHRLFSLSEGNDEENKAVFNILSIFENMVEVKTEVAEMILEKSKLLKWMLARFRPREFDGNKQYTAELLAILLQSSPKNQQLLADANGIDTLLQAIAPYKNRNPGSIDEEEFLENLFNSLCACLMSGQTRTLFCKAEGIELMLLILKQKRLARAGALKALDFATTRSPLNCERFVDSFGLKTVFSIFMGKSKMKRKKGEEADEAEEEERALSLVANLFQGLARGSRRDRLAAKFVENEFEKCDRLMELYLRYHQRVLAAELDLQSTTEDYSEEERMLVRMEQGLYSLQQAALAFGHVWFVGDLGARKRLLQLLHQKNLTLADLRYVLRELLKSIGDESASQAELERDRNRVSRLLSALGYDEGDAGTDPAAAQHTGNGVQARQATGAQALEQTVGGTKVEEDAIPLVSVTDDVIAVKKEPGSNVTKGDTTADLPHRDRKHKVKEEGERGGKHRHRDDHDYKARERERERASDRDKERAKDKEHDRMRDKSRDKDREKDKRESDKKHKDSRRDKRHRDEDDRRDRKRERR